MSGTIKAESYVVQELTELEERRASLVLAGMAIDAGASRDELRDVLESLGLLPERAVA